MAKFFPISKTLLLFSLFNSCISTGYAQLYTYDLSWKNILGPVYSDGRAIAQTPDGGFMLASSRIDGNSASDIWIIRTDAAGNVLWETDFGGDWYDDPVMVRVHPDGSFIVLALSGSTGISTAWHVTDVILLKYNADGQLLWWKRYGLPDPDEDDYAYDIRICPDGGYVIAGPTMVVAADGTRHSNAWILRTDAQGDVRWSRHYGGYWDDAAHSVLPQDDGGYIVAVNAQSADGDFPVNLGETDVWLLKLNALGHLVWKKHYGTVDTERGFYLEAAPDGGFMLAGELEPGNSLASNSYGGWNAWVARLDAQGDMLWSNNYGGDKWDGVRGMSPGGNGWYWMNGFTLSDNHDICNNSGNSDYWVRAVDLDGRLVWSETFGGSGFDDGRGIVGIGDGFAAIGRTESDDGDIGQVTDFYHGWVIRVENCTRQEFDLGPADSLLCGESDLWLETGLPDSITLTWNGQPGSDGYLADAPGNYVVEANLNGCSLSDTINIRPGPVLHLPSDTVLCLLDSLVLSVPPGDASVLWSSGSSATSITIHQGGTYSVRLEQEQCVLQDSLYIREEFCEKDRVCIRFPNAFTPDGDGVNDLFRPVNPCALEFIGGALRIFNRWGKEVYSGLGGWDGSVDGQPAPADVYLWTARLEFLVSGAIIPVNMNGDLILIR